MQAVRLDQGGSIETEFLGGLPASCTVTLYMVTENGTLTKKVDTASATLDTVSTTLSIGPRAGDQQVTVVSATGIVAGRRYRIAPAASAEPDENVRVKSISGTVVVLTAPLQFNHAAASTFKGVRASYTVLAAAADEVWINGYADFTASDGRVQTEPVDCLLREIPIVLCDMTVVRQIYPKVDKVLDRELDVPTALRQARDGFLKDWGAARARYVLSATNLSRAVALRFLCDRRFAAGKDWKEEYEMFLDEYNKEIRQLTEQTPMDSDSDGIVNEEEDKQKYFGIRAV